MGELVLDSKDSGTQAKRNCIQCGSCLGDKDFSCPNCGSNQQAVGQPHTRKVEDKGRQYNPYSNDPHSNPMQFQKGVALNKQFSDDSSLKEATTKDPKSKTNRDIVPYVSDDFLQCTDPTEMPRRKRRKDVDKHIEEVSKSCLDLAIDG